MQAFGFCCSVPVATWPLTGETTTELFGRVDAAGAQERAVPVGLIERRIAADEVPERA